MMNMGSRNNIAAKQAEMAAQRKMPKPPAERLRPNPPKPPKFRGDVSVPADKKSPIPRPVDRLRPTTPLRPPMGAAKGGMASKKGYAKGGMANCGASMKPAQKGK